MRRVVLSLAVLSLLPLKVYAAEGELAWAKRAGGAGYEEGRGIAALADGSVLVTGEFGGSATFGTGEAGETTLTSDGAGMFIARYYPDGTLKWAKRAVFAEGYDIVALSDGSSLVTGTFLGNAIFGPGEIGETTLTAAGYAFNIFVARYNPDGTLTWAKRAGGVDPAIGFGIAALADGSALVTGVFEGSATFGPGEAGETTFPSASEQYVNMFVARYNPDGALVWVISTGNDGIGIYGMDMGIAALADGSALVTGQFYNSITFGSGEVNETTLTSAGFDDIFIARFNPDGSLAGAKSAGGEEYDEGYAIAALSDGSALVTGSFWGKATFGPGEAGETMLTSAQCGEIFVARYNTDGTLVWAKQTKGTETYCDFTGGNGIAALTDGSALVTGKFADSVTFGPGEAEETTLPAAAKNDIFVAQYNPDGTLAWAKRAGSGNWFSEGDDGDVGYGIAALSDGSAFVTGGFWCAGHFGPGEAGETTLVSAGGTDIFIAKYVWATAQLNLNGSLFARVDLFSATFQLNKSVTQPFTVYAVVILPNGSMIDALTFGPNVKPVASNARQLDPPFSYPLLSLNLPANAPLGQYEVVAAFFDPNKPIKGRRSAFLDVSAKFTIR